VLLPDAPDAETSAELSALTHIPQLATTEPFGAPACFNRLAQVNKAEKLVFVESGTIVSPGWLEKLVASLSADSRNGLACPSTNFAWNRLAAFPHGQSDDASIIRTAIEADRRFGESWQHLAPLWDVGDFCLAVRREVIDTVGLADETYGLGPCWEMDYAIRAVRKGFIAVWAKGAYVFRHPFTSRRTREEARLFEASRHRYQDKFCGLRLSGARTGYASHCRGDACRHFAPLTATGTPVLNAPLHSETSERWPQAAVDDYPLVSCIMPTHGRPKWLAQAIHYFQNQDYPSRELIIVDTSPDNLCPLIPDDPQIHHHRIPPPRSIGAMRNIACDAARGEIIVHWDDDDWYAANRITAQVRPILDGRADVTGLTNILFFEIDQWTFWRCSPELHRRMFVLDVQSGTLAFRKSLFGRLCRYPDRSIAEDAIFLSLAVNRGARLQRIPGDGLYIYLRHSNNAWAFRCGYFIDPKGWWRTEQPSELADDRDFYVSSSGMRLVSMAAEASLKPTIPQQRPLVSCIMPTANRRRFVRHAIEHFLTQDYGDAELIILDDGEDAVGDLVPSHPALRYVRTPRHRSLGAKRNAGCEAARADIIMHWDDDDWYASHRIRLQAEALCDSQADICGIDRVLFFDPRVPAAWEYYYPTRGAPWLYGASLCYRREYWRAHPFLDITVGEDACFVAAARSDRSCALPDNRFFVALVHAANTSAKQVRDPRWRPRPVETIRAITGGNWPDLDTTSK
jgi:glycosyltransferase involved in cell wall biosynthesis